MTISINRALSEIKLLNKKIEDKTNGLSVASGVTSKENEDVKKAFVAAASAGIDQVKGFIDRRNVVKAAIVLSNAAVEVTVAGVTMTVAEAIERKTSIELEKSLNKRIREQYYGHKKSVEQHNEQCKAKADKQAEAALGADTEGDKGLQYKAIFDAYYDSNKADLLAPVGIEVLIENMQDELDEFENEVDFILSESNTKTVIEV